MAQKKNHQRRRRGRGGFGPFLRLLSVVLTAVVIVAALTLFFKVEQISVKGNSRYTAEEIIAACGVMPGDNLVLLDKYRIAERLYTQLPYITGVRINRAFPDGLTIIVTETVSALAIESGDRWWLLSADGKVVDTVSDEEAQQHVILIGVTAQLPAPGSQLKLMDNTNISEERLLELISKLAERDMLKQTQRILTDDSEILVLEYDNRFRVELYYDADFDFKLDCLQAAVNELEPNETGIIRMTMKNENEVRLIPFGKG